MEKFKDIKIDYIFHVADIHIRNLKRHKEYRSAFEKLYKELDNAPKNTLVIIAGDVFHNKTDISPEAVQLASEFINELSNRRPTLLFKGNHDANLNNLDRLDALSPIVYSLNHPNLVYLEKSGVYEIGEYNFILWEVGDEIDKYISPLDVPGEKQKIVLYHGTVENILLTDKMEIHSGKVPFNLFQGAYLGILGDIHKHQFLDEDNVIGYASSLIMQNYGEHPTDHGYILWDVKQRSGKFIRLENDYGYITIKLKQNSVIEEPSYFPKFPRIRIISEDCDNIFINKYISDLKQKIKPYELITQKVNKITSNKENHSVTKIGNLKDINTQNEILSPYYSEMYGLDEYQISLLNKLNENTNQKLSEDNLLRNIIWEPIQLEFSNLFSYGENNIIKFDNIEGIIGLFAPNHTGKSALIDTLSFALFDTTIRTTRTQDILNINKDNFHVKFTFKIENKIYAIERKGTKIKRYKDKTSYFDVKVDVDFYEVGESGEHISLNGEQRRETNKIIKNYVGDFDSFLLTSLSAQNNYITFINKTQSERKNILSQFSDLNIFDSLYEIANNESKEINYMVKKYENDDLYTKLNNEVENNKLINESKQTEEDNIKKLDKIKENLNNEIISKSSKLINIGINENISDLETRLTNLSKEKTVFETKKSSYKDTLLETKNKGKILLETKKSFPENIGTLYEESILEESKLNQIETEINLLKKTLENQQEKLEAIGQFDPNCDFCKNTPFIKNAWKLTEEIKQTQQSITDLVNSKSKYNTEKNNKIKTQYEELKSIDDELQSLVNQIKTQTSEIEKIDLSIKNIDEKISNINEKIKIHNDNKNTIENNNELESKIEELKKILNNHNTEYKQLQKNLEKNISEFAISNSNITHLKHNISEFEDLSHKKILYEYYINSVSKNGLPYKLMLDMIPTLENEINNILAQIVDFKILIETEDKDINLLISYDHGKKWSIELSSGMEKFITSIAIRIALMNVSNIPRPNFLIIDEGFANLDKDSLNSLYYLFDYLKQTFKFILIVSHIDFMKDMAQSSINISQINGFSQINHIY